MRNAEDSNKNEELAKALLNSNAFNSLSVEGEVFEIASKYFPRASQSPYFTDIDTGKLREIDIVAQARYGNTKKNKLYCSVYFIIECKSNKNFNIIASGQDPDSNRYVMDCVIWAGADVNNRFEKTRKLLASFFLDNDYINDCLQVLTNIFYRKDGTRKTLAAEPEIFSNISSYPSFRETNIKDEKDIENSVLWRAFQSLSSAQEAFKQDVSEAYEKAILNFGEYKVNNKLYKLELSLDDTLGYLASSIDIIQKIVVIDSPLWKRTNNNIIEPIKYFRLLRQKIGMGYMDFVDVVNRKYFSEYMEVVSSHYLKMQKEKKLVRIF